MITEKMEAVMLNPDDRCMNHVFPQDGHKCKFCGARKVKISRPDRIKLIISTLMIELEDYEPGRLNGPRASNFAMALYEYEDDIFHKKGRDGL